MSESLSVHLWAEAPSEADSALPSSSDDFEGGLQRKRKVGLLRDAELLWALSDMLKIIEKRLRCPLRAHLFQTMY